jgi:hypothetical protein
MTTISRLLEVLFVHVENTGRFSHVISIYASSTGSSSNIYDISVRYIPSTASRGLWSSSNARCISISANSLPNWCHQLWLALRVQLRPPPSTACPSTKTRRPNTGAYNRAHSLARCPSHRSISAKYFRLLHKRKRGCSWCRTWSAETINS